MGIVSEVFCDYLNVTFPADVFPDAQEAVLGLATLAGGYQAVPGLVRWDGSSGTLKHGHRFGTGFVSLSGAALARLRHAHVMVGNTVGHSFFVELLSVLGAYPHRVAQLHATLDVVADGRTVIPALYERAQVGAFSLTRKCIPPRQVKWLRRSALYGPGQTGTVYVGNRTRDVWFKVYDKRNELLDRAGDDDAGRTLDAFPDPGDLVRYELALGRHVGCTLRDVADPAAVFWHHMREVLAAPAGAPIAWAPMGEGFSVPAPVERLPYTQLQLLLENSPDIARAVALADRMGPHGRQLLSRLLDKIAPASAVVRAA